jgi:hypothetical protein
MNTLRYLVLCLDTNSPQPIIAGKRVDLHEGRLFHTKELARAYLEDNMDGLHYDRYVIATVDICLLKLHASVCDVQTYGFKNDPKNRKQLWLFEGR